MAGGTDVNYVASVVATYWFVSISMVYLNKVLMSGDSVSIPAPLFVTWFQCIVTAGICWLAGEVALRMKKREQQHYLALQQQQQSQQSQQSQSDAQSSADIDDAMDSKSSFWSQFPKAEYKIATGRNVFSLSLIFVGMITFNNVCLKYVEVSFYNVARSLTIVFNVIFSNLLLGSTTSTNTIICLAVVIAGFFIGSKGELNFSVFGTVAGVISSLFVSLNSIYTKKVLPVVDNDHWRLTFYNNVNGSILFIPLMIVFEWEPILAGINQQFMSGLFWMAMMVAGFFGFAIGIVTVLQIKATSPLSHNISGTAKAAVQSILAFFIWKNQPTFMGILGIFTVLGGSLAYTIVKLKESNNNKGGLQHQQQQQQPKPAPEKDVEVADIKSTSGPPNQQSS